MPVFDLVVLGFIFFGYATYGALASYFSGSVNPFDMQGITDIQNWYSIAIELIMLTMAGGYLYLRHFDFKTLDFSLSRYTFPFFLLLVVVGSIAADIGLYTSYLFFSPEIDYTAVAATQTSAEVSPYAYISVSLFFFSLLNGFYEELFFMGFVFAADKRHRSYALAGSLFVRFIFHIYQGIPVAIGILFMGIAFILLRKRIHSLVPFMLAHAIFDMFGASFYAWMYPYIS